MSEFEAANSIFRTWMRESVSHFTLDRMNMTRAPFESVVALNDEHDYADAESRR